MIWLSLAVALAAPNARYALVAGANDGGGDRVKLQFATTDAVAVGSVLTELGGVPDEHLVVLADPSRAELRASIAEIGRRIGSQSDASAVVYYSGHSDQTGLLLQGETYGYADLRADLEQMGAGVLVAIVDGCASGAMVRAKGGSAIPAFLPGSEVLVEGRAYLTSSSADELSQEADHIGSSYFTHALVTGLRGAADFDDDHRVTLREAHQFAADETLARTQRTRLGAQHPTYDIQLSGIGDYVLTDVGRNVSRIALAKELRGRVYLRDQDGRLVAELFKRGGREVELGVPPGKYEAVVDDGGALYEAKIRVEGSAVASLALADLDPIEGEVTVARGRVYARVPVAVSVVPYPTSEGPDSRDQLQHVSLGLLAIHAARLRGFGLGTVGTSYRDGVQGLQLGFVYAVSGGEASGLQVATMNFAGPVHGAQIGAVSSYSSDNRGVQISTVNLAKRSAGLQIGVVNLARSHSGLSVGVVQVSKSSKGAALAVLPLIGDGIHHIEVSTGTSAPLNLGFKLGSRAMYTQYLLGYNPVDGAASGGMGFGARIRPGAWNVDLDGVVSLGYKGGASVLPALRATVARPLKGESFAPFATISVGFERMIERGAESTLWLAPVGLSDGWSVAPGGAVGFRI